MHLQMLWYHNLCMYEFVDFHADWCGPCKIMDPIIEQVEKDYTARVKFSKVDVEVEGEKAANLGVMGIPTFIIFKDGKEVSRKVGAMPKDVLKTWIESSI